MWVRMRVQMRMQVQTRLRLRLWLRLRLRLSVLGYPLVQRRAPAVCHPPGRLGTGCGYTAGRPLWLHADHLHASRPHKWPTWR